MIIPSRNKEDEYNKKNLKKEYDKGYIDGMERAMEELGTFKDNLDVYDGLTECDELKTLGILKKEFIDYVIDCAINWLDGETDEANAWCIEGQDEE